MLSADVLTKTSFLKDSENENRYFKREKSLNFSCSALKDSDIKKKNTEQWRKVLGTFDLIKDHPSVKKRKASKQSSGQKIIHKFREAPLFQSTSKRRSILSDSFANKNNDHCKQNLEDLEIIWSSSNEESDSGSDIRISKSSTCISRRKTHLKRCHYETEINWSSSNGSDEEEISAQNNRSSDFQKEIDSEYELHLFVQEIEKDLRQAKKIKHKLKNKNGGYLECFRKAVNKAKTDEGFLAYEHRTNIICGLKGIISEKEKTYGASFANVRLESGSNCYIFSGKNIQSSHLGSNIVCFIDDSYCYKVNGKSIYIQPNKVIRA